MIKICKKQSAGLTALNISFTTSSETNIDVYGIQLTNWICKKLFQFISLFWGRVECFVLDEQKNIRQYVWLYGEDQFTGSRPYDLFRESRTEALTSIEPLYPAHIVNTLISIDLTGDPVYNSQNAKTRKLDWSTVLIYTIDGKDYTHPSEIDKGSKI